MTEKKENQHSIATLEFWRAKAGPNSQLWGAALSALFAVLIYILSQIFVGLYIQIKGQGDKERVSQIVNNLTPDVSFTISVISATVISFSVIGLMALKKSNLIALRVKKPTWPLAGKVLLTYGAYFLLNMLVLIAIALLFPRFNQDQPQDVGFGATSSPLDLIMAFAALVILPPIVEELLFRGFLYQGLRQRIPRWVAALITSALFGLVHGQWNVGIDTFVLSLVLIYLLEDTDNLVASMMLHALKNSIAFIILFAPSLR